MKKVLKNTVCNLIGFHAMESSSDELQENGFYGLLLCFDESKDNDYLKKMQNNEPTSLIDQATFHIHNCFYSQFRSKVKQTIA